MAFSKTFPCLLGISGRRKSPWKPGVGENSFHRSEQPILPNHFDKKRSLLRNESLASVQAKSQSSGFATNQWRVRTIYLEHCTKVSVHETETLLPAQGLTRVSLFLCVTHLEVTSVYTLPDLKGTPFTNPYTDTFTLLVSYLKLTFPI